MTKGMKRHRPRGGSAFRGVQTIMATTALGCALSAPLEAGTRRGVVVSGESLRQTLAMRIYGSGPASIEVQAQEPPARRFDIAGGPLNGVLKAFEAATGIRVVGPPDIIAVMNSPGVTGLHTPEAALRAILAGTSLEPRFTGPNTVTLSVLNTRETVTVTGATKLSSAKFTESVLNTPQTITVISNDVIEQQGATTLRDVLRNVPGITYQAGEGGGGLPGDTLTMRGFGASNDIFVDGMRDVGAFSRDAFNLEQVEVVKGPSSTFGGRGSVGGAINLVTKSPHPRPALGANVGAGTAAAKRGAIDVNRLLSSEKGAALRVNAMWSDGGVPGRDVVENRSWGVAPSLALGLGSDTRLTAAYQHVSQDNVPDYGLPWAALDASPAVDQSNFYGLRNYDFERISSDSGTLQFDRDLTSRVTLRNTTRYGETIRQHAITAPRPPNRQLQQRYMRNEGVGNFSTVRASFDAGVGHELAGGFEVLRETTATYNSAQSSNQPPTNIDDPNPWERPLGPMPPNTGNPGATTLRTIGGYLFDTVSLGSRLLVTGGARWDHSDVDYTLTERATGAVTDLGRTDATASWRAGMVFKPTPAASVYVGAGSAFSPAVDARATGAALSSDPAAANNVALEPEKSRSYEAGLKWQLFGARLIANAAVFRTEKVNARTRNAANEPFVLAGRQRVDGVELGASGQVMPRWSLLASFAYMDSETVRSANPTEQDRDLAFTPETTFSLWTGYDIGSRLRVGGGAQFMDAVFRNSTNTAAAPSYWLLQATADYDLSSHLTLRVLGHNLGDAKYVDRVGGGHYIPGPRRSAMLTIDVRY